MVHLNTYFLKPAPPLSPLMSRLRAKLARLASRSPLSKLCELAELGTDVEEEIGTAELLLLVVVEELVLSPGPNDDTFIGWSTSPNASKPVGKTKKN